MTIRTSPALASLALFCLSTAACTIDARSAAPVEGVAAQSSAALTPSTAISHHAPDGIVYSQGNVYFTTHATYSIFTPLGAGPARDGALKVMPSVTTSSVLRTGKLSTPGQEITLWSENGSRFGDIVWALVDGNYYGYFLSQSLATNQVTIKRVPLPGGTAIDIAGGIGTDIDIVNGHHLLDTDGVNLYWQDATGVYKMPIAGGPHTPLDTTTPNTPTAGVYVVQGNVYYATSTGLVSVPTGGTTLPPSSRTLVHASTRITAIEGVAYGAAPLIAMGLQDGSASYLFWGQTPTIKPADGIIPTSFAESLGVYSYTECAGANCFLGGGQLALTQVSSGAFGLDLDGVSGGVAAYWGDSTGVHTLTAPVIY